MENRILVVEDERDLAELVAYNLRQSGHTVQVVHTGEEALEAVRLHKPKLILLDIMLPDVSGIEVCRQLKRSEGTEQIPIVMLTARGEEVDRVVGFELGVDDYVIKPFSPRELVLRVAAVLRRSIPPAASAEQRSKRGEQLEFGILRVDVPKHLIWVEDEQVSLTALEFRLLLHLTDRLGRVQSRDALLEEVWGYSSGAETRTVDTHVKRLREKLGKAAEYLETVRGVGYCFRCEAN